MEKDHQKLDSPGSGNKLLPVLGLFSAAMIVVGEVIGSGIFFKPRPVAQATGGHVGLILTLWVVCGLVNLCGALAMAELSAMFPHAGGNYIFLRETYGRRWAFLWAWTEFWVVRTGSIAALAVYFSISFTQLVVANPKAQTDLALIQTIIATLAIAWLASVNIAGTIWGGAVQNVVTIVKIASIAFLAMLPMLALEKEPFALGDLWPQQIDSGLIVGIGAAVAAIMWAYDGWGNVTVIAEEIRNPERNVPRALIWGVLLLILLYTGANLAYHLTLPSSALAAAPIPAAAVGEKLLPGWGEKLLVGMLMTSVFGALSGNILVGPRVVYAVGRDYPVFAPLGRVHRRTHTPIRAIAAMCSWAMSLVWIGFFSPQTGTPLPDMLTNYCIFGGSIFYFSAVLAVFVLRIRRPDAVRPYRTWGYPVVPLIFVVFYVFLLASMLWNQPLESCTGLLLLAIGLVVHVAISRSGGNTELKSRL